MAAAGSEQTVGHQAEVSALFNSPVKPKIVLAVFMLCAALLLWLSMFTDIDHRISAWYFDAELQRFPLRNAELYEYWLHSVLRKLLWFLPLLVTGLLLRSALLSGWSLITKRWLWLLSAQLAAALSVSILKSHTSPICPWDSIAFGGKLMDPEFAFTSRALAGHCFPAGHPSGAWALLAWAYFLRESKPAWSRPAFWSALLLGALMAWVQIARGAHLLSHVLWSLWVCWLLVWLAYEYAWPHNDAATDGR
jgi:membrane-associated PAP2 superfamily phosphatase